MDRREAIKRTSLAMGGVISAPVLAALMKGCSPSRSLEWQPTFFTPEQAMSIEDISDRIIPETETPGAKGVGVPQLVEELVSAVLKSKDRDRFMKGLEDLEKSSQETFGKSFHQLSEGEQYELLGPLNEEAANSATRYLMSGYKEERVPSFFRMMKEITIAGYYSSEVGASQELEFQEIPGNYDGCIPLAETSGKTLAT